MKRLPIFVIALAAFSCSVAVRATAQSEPRMLAQTAVPQAGVPQTTVPPVPSPDADVDISFNDGRKYVGDALVEKPKQIVIVPGDKSTTTFVNGKPPHGAYVIIPDGPGEITYVNGSTLTAVFANGVPNGEGEYKSPNGFDFKGVFTEGQPSHGTATYPDGSSYTGDFAQGEPAGQGTLTAVGRVTKADGTWVAGSLSSGTVTFSDGATYVGGLDASGKVNGPAHFTLPDGAVLSGTFVDGNYSGRMTECWNPRCTGRVLIADITPAGPTFSGPAKLTFGNRNTLVGSVTDGRFDGPGAFTLRDGSAFRGTLTNGAFEGPITYTNGHGLTIRGRARDGRLLGPAVLTTPRGRTVHGIVAEDGSFFSFTGPVDMRSRPNGRGTYTYIDGETVTGHWVHGKLVGPITDRLPDGTTYYVDVKYPSDDLVGAARVVLANGNVALGRLERDGYLQGAGSFTFVAAGFEQRGTWVDGTLHVVHY